MIRSYILLFCIVFAWVRLIFPAYSQSHSILKDLIFGPQQNKQSSQPKSSPSHKSLIQKNIKKIPVVSAIPKNKDAKKFLIIGDFLANALADGLNEAYSKNPDIIIIKTIKEDFSLIPPPDRVNDFSIAEIISQKKPDLIIIMLGTNDFHSIVTTDPAQSSLKTTSQFSATHYHPQIKILAETLTQSAIPWIWMGLPPFKEQNSSQKLANLNTDFKYIAEEMGGHFVDIWDGFVDENGTFSLSGYDINGQIARLRSNDGIQFTNAGNRKLALYAEQTIQALLDPPLQDGKIAKKTESREEVTNIRYIGPVNLWNQYDNLSYEPSQLAGAVNIHSSKRKAGHNPGFLSQYKSYKGRADHFYNQKDKPKR